jgi:hypothetical protein
MDSRESLPDEIKHNFKVKDDEFLEFVNKLDKIGLNKVEGMGRLLGYVVRYYVEPEEFAKAANYIYTRMEIEKFADVLGVNE